MMRLLYIPSGHALQCAYDVLMWDKLNIDWFSTCYYTNTDSPGILPTVKRRLNSHEDFVYEFNQCESWTEEPDVLIKKNSDYGGKRTDTIFKFKKRFLNMFDVILVSHTYKNLQNVLQHINPKRKLVILKTFGMHCSSDEKQIKKFRENGGIVVRNSPKEHLMYTNYFAGADEIIRGSVVKDEYEISGWNGDCEQVITFVNGLYCPFVRSSIKRRERYIKIINGLNNVKFICHGSEYYQDPNNISKGFITHEEKVQLLKNSRVNLVIGTPNANNTYSFVESWVMGMPTVVFGRQLWQGNAYEPDELITNGKDGFIVNSNDEAISIIKELIENKSLAQKIGNLGREKAISIYGRDILACKWKDFFNKYYKRF